MPNRGRLSTFALLPFAHTSVADSVSNEKQGIMANAELTESELGSDLKFQDLGLDGSLSRWLRQVVAKGDDESAVISALEGAGLDQEKARKAFQKMTDILSAGELAASPSKRDGAWMRIRQQLRDADANWAAIPRVECLQPAEFLRDYYAANRPVILTDVVSRWPAVSKWNGDYLTSVVGDELVEIMGERNSDSNFELNSLAHRREVSFSEFAKRVFSETGNDAYLTANNRFLERPFAETLLQDFDLLPEFIEGTNWKGYVFFWFGPSGTVTPLHHDTMNIFMAQVVGSKRILLIPPEQSEFVYNQVGVFGGVDPEFPDFDAFPLYAKVSPASVTLRPGELLFLPVGWWHHVRSLAPSITITFTNFQYPNRYEWSLP